MPLFKAPKCFAILPFFRLATFAKISFTFFLEDFFGISITVAIFNNCNVKIKNLLQYAFLNLYPQFPITACSIAAVGKLHNGRFVYAHFFYIA